MQRIGDLKSFTSLRDGESLEFPSARMDARRVRLEVNSAADLVLYISPLAAKDGKGLELLSVTKGLDKLDFHYAGGFRVTAEGNGYVRCMDGKFAHVEKTDHRVFARIAERKPRNYQLELAMRVAAENQERRFKAMIDEQERRLAAMKPDGRAEEPAPAPADDKKASPAKPSKQKPKPDRGSGPPVEADEDVDDGSE